MAAERRRVRAVRAEQQQPVARDEVHQASERQQHGGQVRVDIRVIELDVVDDGDIRQVLQELRRLVEERAVVFVALDDEVAAAADTVARSSVAEIQRNPANEHRGIEAAVRQQPPGQRRRRRLAVRAGDDDRSCAPEESIANRFGQRAVPDFAFEHALELGVAARDRIADDHQIDVRADVICRIAGHDADALGLEEVAHRRIDVLVGAADVVAAVFQQRGEGRHRRAADADQVDPATCPERSRGATQRETPRRRSMAAAW